MGGYLLSYNPGIYFQYARVLTPTKSAPSSMPSPQFSSGILILSEVSSLNLIFDSFSHRACTATETSSVLMAFPSIFRDTDLRDILHKRFHLSDVRLMSIIVKFSTLANQPQSF